MADVNSKQMNICLFIIYMGSSQLCFFLKELTGQCEMYSKSIENLYEADEELMMFVGFALCLGTYIVFCTFFL